MENVNFEFQSANGIIYYLYIFSSEYKVGELIITMEVGVDREYIGCCYLSYFEKGNYFKEIPLDLFNYIKRIAPLKIFL